MKTYHFDTIDSTNEQAKRLVRDGTLREPALLIAAEQTAGRGRRGKPWLSPRNAGLYLTVVEQPTGCAVAPTTALTLAAGIACVETLADNAAVQARLKPINDVYVDGRKLGGILTESILEDGHVAAVITGVGINTRRADRSLPQGSPAAICLEELLPPDRFDRLDLNALVAALVVRIRLWNRAVFDGHTDQVREHWESHAIGPPTA